MCLSRFKPGEKVVEGGRVGLSHGRLWYSEVESGRARVECGRVRWSWVQPG